MGTAVVPAAVHAGQAWGANLDVRVRQGHGTGRASLIEVHAEHGAMTLTGVVRKFAEGTCEVY